MHANIFSERSKLEKLRKVTVYMQCTVTIYRTNSTDTTIVHSQTILSQTFPESPPNLSTKIPG